LIVAAILKAQSTLIVHSDGQHARRQGTFEETITRPGHTAAYSSQETGEPVGRKPSRLFITRLQPATNHSPAQPGR